jgi:NAD-dependent DNA ligase
MSLQKLRLQSTSPISDKYYDDLQTSLDNWRESRNKIVHGMVKSIPGKDHQDILDFKEEAKIAAIQGERLARSLCNWSKRINKQLSKENLDCGD